MSVCDYNFTVTTVTKGVGKVRTSKATYTADSSQNAFFQGQTKKRKMSYHLRRHRCSWDLAEKCVQQIRHRDFSFFLMQIMAVVSDYVCSEVFRNTDMSCVLAIVKLGYFEKKWKK